MSDIDFEKAARTILTPLTQWERLRHPHAGWARVALGLSFPFVIWSHNIVLILIWLAAVIGHIHLIGPYVESGKNTPLMTRLTDAFQNWFENASKIDKILLFGPGAVLILPLVIKLWSHNLMASLYFFAALAGFKVLFLYRLMMSETREPESTDHA